jgi:tRNA(adenine34) deaminase
LTICDWQFSFAIDVLKFPNRQSPVVNRKSLDKPASLWHNQAMEKTMTANEDHTYLRRAIELALRAEGEGNLPIGAVIVLDDEIVGEGYSHIWVPSFAAMRHAEMEALRAVDPALWPRAKEMTLYTTLEPCLMCTGAIILYHVGRLVYGASDSWGGLGSDWQCLPPYFQRGLAEMRWEGPVLPEECDELFTRVLELIAQRGHTVPPEERP